MNTGEKGIVTFCKVPNEQIRKQLKAISINTGNKITVIQKFPFWKIKVNNINLIIEREIARAIYVRIIDN